MNEAKNLTAITDMQMINWEYKDWFVSNSINHGMLITQAQAAKILGKTRGRISQMISEKKLTSFTYDDETPLVSLAEVSQICDKEKEKIQEMQEAISDAINNGYRPDDEYLVEDEPIIYDDDLNDIPDEVLEIIKKEQFDPKKEKKKLQQQVEELQEKISLIDQLGS